MTELKIFDRDSGQRLNKYLMKYLNTAPSSFVYKMLRKKNIVLNGKRAQGDEILCAGDVVKLFLSDETILKFRNFPLADEDRITRREHKTMQEEKQAGKRSCLNTDAYISPDRLRVLYRDADIMAVHKPVGILSQKSREDDYSINECIVDYCREYGVLDNRVMETFTPSVCNRLDRNTSGIILAGISLRGSQRLAKILRDRLADKYYYTVVAGELHNVLHEMAYIKRDSQKYTSEVIDEETYQRLSDSGQDKQAYMPIETEFIPLCHSAGYTLLQVKLITGKSHQIRAHLGKLGYPVLGDTKYGSAKVNKDLYERYQLRLRHHLLHAGLVVLPAENDDGKEITVIDSLPTLFRQVCIKLELDISMI